MSLECFVVDVVPARRSCDLFKLADLSHPHAVDTLQYLCIYTRRLTVADLFTASRGYHITILVHLHKKVDTGLQRP
jgi:hypothetical protein